MYLDSRVFLLATLPSRHRPGIVRGSYMVAQTARTYSCTRRVVYYWPHAETRAYNTDRLRHVGARLRLEPAGSTSTHIGAEDWSEALQRGR